MGRDYTFGDSDLAAHRLSLLSETVVESTRSALEGLALRKPVDVAVDLGCGPGHSTSLLHDVLGARTTIGIDDSRQHVARARQAFPRLTFSVHDVTEAPLPCPPADLVQARFLVTHLADPVAALRTWGAALASPDCLVVLHETEHLWTDHEDLNAYYDAVERLQRHHGQSLYVGRELEHTATRAGLETVSSIVHRTLVPGPRMARLHRLNLASWRTSPAARAIWSNAELDRLENALRAAEGDGRPQFVVDHGMQIVVLKK